MRLYLPTMLTLAACSNVPCGSGDTQTGVVSELVFARVDDAGVSKGFDLDEATSDEGGLSGCGIGDYTDPDGSNGVDNAMARLLPALDLTEAVAMEDLILQMINSGELLLMRAPR